jgi:hypothetical protein
MNKTLCSAAVASGSDYRDDNDLEIAYSQWRLQTDELLKEADCARGKRQWRKALTLLSKAQKITRDFHLTLKTEC